MPRLPQKAIAFILIAMMLIIIRIITSTPSSPPPPFKDHYLYCHRQAFGRCLLTTSTYDNAVDLVIWDRTCQIVRCIQRQPLNEQFSWGQPGLPGQMNATIWDNGWKMKFSYRGQEITANEYDCVEFYKGYVACQPWFYCPEPHRTRRVVLEEVLEG